MIFIFLFCFVFTDPDDYITQGEEDYMSNLGLYDGYDSYNEMSGSSSDDDGENEKPGYSNFNFPSSGQPTPFRFINGKDGMGTYAGFVMAVYHDQCNGTVQNNSLQTIQTVMKKM